MNQVNSDGYTGRATDTKRTVWAKILTWYQSQSGANAANDLRHNDTTLEIKQKVLKAKQ